MVSSYTPTLNSLLISPPVTSMDLFKMLVAIQPETKGQVVLTQTREEMRQIERHVPASSLIKLGVDGSELSKVDTVLAHLSHASIAHFACHGVQNLANPLESALLLDGQLKVSTIMAQSLPKASLAFLSACETAKGTVELPDEAMHLAGTMLFSGFRSVVATKWSVSVSLHAFLGSFSSTRTGRFMTTMVLKSRMGSMAAFSKITKTARPPTRQNLLEHFTSRSRSCAPSTTTIRSFVGCHLFTMGYDISREVHVTAGLWMIKYVFFCPDLRS